MNFLHLEYLPVLVGLIFIFALMVYIFEKKFFKLVKTYWFYKRSILSVISSFLFVLGMGGLLLALLDVRGPEEKIKMPVPSERTIILIDTSASMLAEDVKPSRLQKATLIAKHFARKAAGHQISVVVFAEIQKKIVPFTNDLDLIDSRLESVKGLRNHYGSSALSLALQESIQYFKEGGGKLAGNILVLTDGEETAGGINLKIPPEIHVALVGIGTTQGGRIPLDDTNGFRFGYKKHRGQDVITKLNEDFFKVAASDISSAKYWLASSYSLPSDEILSFFTGEKVKGLNEQDMVIRPVLMEWIVVPAIILIMLSQFLKAVRIFSLGLLLLIAPVHSKEVKLSEEIIMKMEELQNGKLNQLERLKLADEIYKSGLKEEALTLYNENLDSTKVDQHLPPEAYLNYGTALLDKGQTKEGLETYGHLLDSLPDGSEKKKEIQSLIEKNTVTHFRQQEEKKQQQKKDQQKNKDKDKKNEGSQEQSGQDQGNNDKQQSKEGKKPEDQNDKKDQEGDKDKNDEGNQDDEDKDGDDAKKDEQANNGDRKPLPPKKLPAKLKQLLSDDRQLQKQVIENGTRDLNKSKDRKSKDW